MTAGTLGVGTYEVHVYDRGGSLPIGKITDVETLRWNRVRDDISEALVVTKGPFSRTDLVRKMRSVRHELVVFRDGKRVWEGPITRIAFQGDVVEIAARDILWWTSRTAVTTHKTYTGKNKGVSIITVAETLLAMTYDKTVNGKADWLNAWRFRKPYRSASDRKFEGEWVGYQETVYHVLERMAQDWDLDYSCVGRRIYWWDVHTRVSYTHALTDDDFMGPLVMTEYGSELRTFVYTTNAKNVRRRQADQPLRDYYGPVEDINANTSEDADAPALPPIPHPDKPRLAEGPAPIRVHVPDNTRINPRAPVTLDQLVAGAWLPVRTEKAGRPWDGWMKVDQVNVTWTPVAGENINLVIVQAPSDMEDPTP